MTTRREVLRLATGAGLAAAGPTLGRAAQIWQPGELPDGALATAVLEALPGKLPLIKRSYRPPNYETPIEHFREVITPNKAFFVRYHLSGIPTVDARTWRLRVGGDAAGQPFELSFEQLRRDFEAVELTAVCQCSGNRRGMFEPHVQGVEWGVGAMSNARWKGARLRDVLKRVGVKADAIEVAFGGADGPAMPTTPDFVKSIPLDKALDENTLIAWEMNGAPLPHFNGFPARIIVPGWTATYWMKHVTEVNVTAKANGGFWMTPAYRLPAGLFPGLDRFPSQENAANVPITSMVVNSLVTSIHDGMRVRPGQPVEVAGIAWDGGSGIRQVQVSLDDGRSWKDASLARDHGRFSFRAFRYEFRPERQGPMFVMVRATSMRGDAQVMQLIHNPAGYHHNVVPRIAIDVA